MTVLEYTGARKLPPPKVEATPRPQPRRVALRPILRRRTISIPPSAGAGLSVASVVFFVFFRTGSFLASGDVSPMLTDGLRSELGWQWTHQNTGAGGPTYEIARAVEVLFSAIARVLGGTDALGQRLLFSATWGMVAAAGAALAMRFTRCRPLGLVAGIGIVFNPYMLIAQPNLLPLIAIGVSAALLTLAVDAARGRPPRWILLALLTLPCSYLSLNPPLLMVVALMVPCAALLPPFITGTGWRGIKRATGLFLRASPFAILLAAWWAVPAAIAINSADPTTIGAVTSVDAWSWTHARSSIPNVLTLFGHWSWPRREYYGIAVTLEDFPWRLLRWVFPIGVLVAPLTVSRSRRRAAACMAVMVAIAIFIGKGIHEPFGNVNRALYRIVPGFWLFREPAAKVGVVLVVFGTVGFVMTLDALLRRAAPFARIRPYRVQLVALLVMLPIIGVWPLWSGAMVRQAHDGRPGDRPKVPGDWHRLATAVNASELRGKALVLPINDYYQIPTTWGYYGADNLLTRLLTRPVIQSNPQLYIGDSDVFEALMHSVELSIVDNNGTGMESLLRTLGVSHIVVRKDIDFASPVRTLKMTRPETILAGLAHVKELHRTMSTSVGDVFEMTTNPGVAVEALGAVIRTGELSGEDVGVLRSALPPELTLSTGTKMLDLVAGRAVVQGASSTKTTADHGTIGTWAISKYSTAARSFAVSVADDRLSIEELVRWQVGDAALLDPQKVEVPMATAIIGAEINGRLVDKTSGPTLTRLDAGTTARPWAAVDAQSELRPFSGVFDCNNYDDTDVRDLGFGLSFVDGSLGREIELRATRHAACVRAGLMAVTPGSHFYLHLGARSISGTEPRFCLWAKGQQGCQQLPSLKPDASGWSTLSTIWKVPDNVTEADLYVYAEQAPNGVQTVVRYQDPVVQLVRPLEPVALGPPATSPTVVALPPSAQHLRAIMQVEPATVGAFGSIGDCNHFDNRTPEQVGLFRLPIPNGIHLEARQHTACVIAPISYLSPTLPYQVSFEHRTLAGERARYCVLDARAGHCVASGRLGASGSGWKRENIRFDAPSGDPDLRLYVYADGGGSKITITEYRAVSVTPFVDEHLIMLAKDATPHPAPAMSYERISPARYRVRIQQAKAPFVLALSDSWSNAWRVSGLGPNTRIDHLKIDGYRNGWGIDARGDLDLLIEYVPARKGRLAIRVSIFAGAMLALIGLWSRLRQHRCTRRYRSSARHRTWDPRRAARISGRPEIVNLN